MTLRARYHERMETTYGTDSRAHPILDRDAYLFAAGRAAHRALCFPGHPTSWSRSSSGSRDTPSVVDHTSHASATQYDDAVLTRIAPIEKRKRQRDVRDEERVSRDESERRTEARDVEIHRLFESAAAFTRQEMIETSGAMPRQLILLPFRQPHIQ